MREKQVSYYFCMFNRDLLFPRVYRDIAAQTGSRVVRQVCKTIGCAHDLQWKSKDADSVWCMIESTYIGAQNPTCEFLRLAPRAKYATLACSILQQIWNYNSCKWLLQRFTNSWVFSCFIFKTFIKTLTKEYNFIPISHFSQSAYFALWIINIFILYA